MLPCESFTSMKFASIHTPTSSASDLNRMSLGELTFHNSGRGGEFGTTSDGGARCRRPIDRRLYELAHKHCGRQATWRIGAANLQKKCGSKQASKHFEIGRAHV